MSSSVMRGYSATPPKYVTSNTLRSCQKLTLREFKLIVSFNAGARP